MGRRLDAGDRQVSEGMSGWQMHCGIHFLPVHVSTRNTLPFIRDMKRSAWCRPLAVLQKTRKGNSNGQLAWTREAIPGRGRRTDGSGVRRHARPHRRGLHRSDHGYGWQRKQRLRERGLEWRGSAIQLMSRRPLRMRSGGLWSPVAKQRIGGRDLHDPRGPGRFFVETSSRIQGESRCVSLVISSWIS